MFLLGTGRRKNGSPVRELTSNGYSWLWVMISLVLEEFIAFLCDAFKSMPVIANQTVESVDRPGSVPLKGCCVKVIHSVKFRP